MGLRVSVERYLNINKQDVQMFGQIQQTGLTTILGAFVVKECAWNAYPYTKTKFTISSFEKFSISIETRFLSDAGTTENVFNLEKDKLKEYDY